MDNSQSMINRVEDLKKKVESFELYVRDTNAFTSLGFMFLVIVIIVGGVGSCILLSNLEEKVNSYVKLIHEIRNELCAKKSDG